MRRLVALALIALAPACSKSEDKPLPPPLDGQLEPVPNPHGTVTPLPDPEMQEGSVGRAPRRITVAQLDTSIRTVVGRGWECPANAPSSCVDLADVAPSLGKADFANVSTENTEANLVFAKFLEDGARDVCMAQATAELTVTDPNARVLTRTVPTLTGTAGNLTQLSDAQVTELLTYLSTRFWGAPLSGEELPKWKNFFTQAAARAETIKKRDQAFAAMCIAMMTDSRFLTY
ncbi:hypothetical protein [Hyalangium minutum]|uniref:Putative lipoprotein n=1 Tax=Hyalangium minutum TaxID=394096 RepID=A0A085WUM9_9BACT|nr:hypothetical protein [Hyalangium minutum]KFE71392.1 putative lipoprotein [Hyalangium minutum]